MPRASISQINSRYASYFYKNSLYKSIYIYKFSIFIYLHYYIFCIFTPSSHFPPSLSQLPAGADISIFPWISIFPFFQVFSQTKQHLLCAQSIWNICINIYIYMCRVRHCGSWYRNAAGFNFIFLNFIEFQLGFHRFLLAFASFIILGSSWDLRDKNSLC